MRAKNIIKSLLVYSLVSFVLVIFGGLVHDIDTVSAFSGYGYGYAFWTAIENAPEGALELRRSTATADDSNILKKLPNDWALYVDKTLDDSGSPIATPDGFRWYHVIDKTDDTAGWMAAGKIDADGNFIKEYLKNDLRDLSATASVQHSGSDDAAYLDRANLVNSAVEHYYNNTATTPNLYSSADKSRIYQLKTLPDYRGKSMGSFPVDVILGFFAQEDGPSFNNENIAWDYGHGVGQITIKEGEYDNRGAYSDLRIFPCSFESNRFKDCYVKKDPSKSKSPLLYSTNPIDGHKYKFYTNTKQSIYANIKDGLGILRGAYDTYEPAFNENTEWSGTYANRTPGEGGWGDNCPRIIGDGATVKMDVADMRKIVTVKGYNGTPHSRFGFVFDNDDGDCYLSLVADKTTHLDDYYPYYKTNSIDSKALELAKKMQVVDQNKDFIDIHSPGILRIVHNSGAITGFSDTGSLITSLPNIVYDELNGKSAEVYFPDDSYSYEVVGDQAGTYSLTIDHFSPLGTSTVRMHDIPLLVDEIYTYQIDWDALARGERGVTIKIDEDGDGDAEKTIEAGAELTGDEFRLLTETVIDIDPDTLNRKNTNGVITAYIELPDGFSPDMIDAATVALNGVAALEKPVSIGDYDRDGITDLMVKFDRAAVIDALPRDAESVRMTITGHVMHRGAPLTFRGEDTTKIIIK